MTALGVGERQCPACGRVISAARMSQHWPVCASPLRPNCPLCEDGGATCIYDVDARGRPKSRICVRCRQITAIE